MRHLDPKAESGELLKVRLHRFFFVASLAESGGDNVLFVCGIHYFGNCQRSYCGINSLMINFAISIDSTQKVATAAATEFQ